MSMPHPYFSDEAVTVHHADCLDLLPLLPDASVDAVVTDPPYGLEFMGRDWDGADGFRRSLPASARIRTRIDQRTNPSVGKSTTSTPEAYVAGPLYQQWCEQWAAECLRVLKPGGHLLAFGGTRTYHRMTCAIEDAGFEIRDEITWLYGSGFPKSRNLDGDWSGWGTALKPAHEPIVVARKPLAGTVATNVLAHGTGALNVDGCRVPARGRPLIVSQSEPSVTTFGDGLNGSRHGGTTDAGRWPPNVLLDEAAAADLDRQTGILHSQDPATRAHGGKAKFDQDGWRTQRGPEGWYGDSGGASRFFPTFRYEPKAPAGERPRVDDQAHETVKPLDLMRWLVRLVTPPGGLVLDPFAGSGTTAEACTIEGFRCVAIERDAKYLPLIHARLSKPLQPVLAVDL